MPNEAQFTVAGFVATPPNFSATKSGLPTMTMRVAWTPRRVDRTTGEWTDEPTCFVSVKCYGRTAENCKISLEKGDPVVVTGTLRMHDYESKEGTMRTSVDITANAIGHDLSRGTSVFNRRGRKAQPAAGESQAGQVPDAGDGPGTPADEQLPGEPGESGDLAGADLGTDEELAAEVAGIEEQAAEPAAAPF
jgi:single-strand DNA-binding protein